MKLRPRNGPIYVASIFPPRKNRSRGSSRYSRKISPCFGWRVEEGGRGDIYIHVSFLILEFYFTFIISLSRWFLLSHSLEIGNCWIWMRENCVINEIDLTFQSDTVCNNITNNRTLNRKVDLWRLYRVRGNMRIARTSVFLASINIETKKQTLRVARPFLP